VTAADDLAAEHPEMVAMAAPGLVGQLVAGFDGDRLPRGRKSRLENLDGGNQT